MFRKRTASLPTPKFISSISIFVQNKWPLLLRIGFILGVLLGALVLGLIAGKMNPMYALAAALAPLLFLSGEWILNENQQWGPIIVLSMSLFVPMSLPTGTASRLVFSLVFTCIFVALWVLKMLNKDKRFHLTPSPTNFPLLAFIVTTIIALVWSNLFRDPLVVIWDSFPFVQIASTLVMVMLPGAFLLVTNQIKDEKQLRILVGIFLIGGFLGLFRAYAQIKLPVNTNGLFTMWVITLAASLALFNDKFPRWVRAFLVGITAAWVWYRFHYNIKWLAGWLPGFVTLGVIIFFRSKQLTLAFIASIVIFIVLNVNMLTRAFDAEYTNSGETRFDAWITNLNVTREHILFGTGPAGYAAYYMTYFPFGGMATHSNYIDVLAQTGIIGFIFYIWFFTALAIQGLKVVLRVHGRRDFVESLANAAFAGTLGCILMMAFGDWLIPFAYTQSITGYDYIVYSWLFMGTIVVLDNLTKPQEGMAQVA